MRKAKVILAAVLVMLTVGLLAWLAYMPGSSGRAPATAAPAVMPKADKSTPLRLGIIPERDIAGLKGAGIDEIFLPGTTTQTIVDYLRARLASR